MRYCLISGLDVVLTIYLRFWIGHPDVLISHLATMHYGGSLNTKLLPHVTRQLTNLRLLYDVLLLPSRKLCCGEFHTVLGEESYSVMKTMEYTQIPWNK
ncbi:hypothetical protein C0J52_12931 [Blattella germanica]|nr:hypothetical protein C0J52_12931 [Blattella germanica]